MSINNVYLSKDDNLYQMQFSILQVTTPNFLQVIINPDNKIIRVDFFDKDRNNIRSLGSDEIFQLMRKANKKNINTNSIHAVIPEETEIISLFTVSKLQESSIQIFGFQNVRLGENYKPNRPESEYPTLSYFKRLFMSYGELV